MKKDPTGLIARWNSSNGAKQTNSQTFLSELCDALCLLQPDFAQTVNEDNIYSFERGVYVQGNDVANVSKRFDIYRHGCFLLDAKQGRDAATLSPGQTSCSSPVRGLRQWRDTMQQKRKQPERCVRILSRSANRLPFVIVVDVGYCFDLYTDYSCTCGSYLHYPDPRNHRIMLKDL